MCDETTRGEAQGEITRVLCSGGRRDAGETEGQAGTGGRVLPGLSGAYFGAIKCGEGWGRLASDGDLRACLVLDGRGRALRD